MKQYHWHKGDKKSNKFWKWITWRLPRPLVYWASLRLVANATQGKYSSTVVPELSMMDALGRWE